jgi:hypothetical protein
MQNKNDQKNNENIFFEICISASEIIVLQNSIYTLFVLR